MHGNVPLKKKRGGWKYTAESRQRMRQAAQLREATRKANGTLSFTPEIINTFTPSRRLLMEGWMGDEIDMDKIRHANMELRRLLDAEKVK